ncbi:MAG: beta-1,3-glucanase family protein [Saprospiraceae bacterium]
MLTLQFENLSGIDANQIFITPYTDSDKAYDVKVQDSNGQLIDFPKNTSLSLAEIGSSGVQISAMDSARFYVSFNKRWTITTPKVQPSAVAKTDAWYHTQWDKFEITMNGNPGDQANLTSIDFVGIPMRLETRDINGNILQKIGYPDGNKVVSNLALENVSAAVTDTGNVNGKVVRVIGPFQNTYPDIGHWPSFEPYVKSLFDNSQITQIHRAIALVINASANLMFAYQFNASVNPDQGMSLTGTISTTNTQNNSAPASNSGSLSIDIQADSTKGTYFSSFVYAGVGNAEANGETNVTFGGDWEQYFDDTIRPHMSGSSSDDIHDKIADCMETVQKTIIGDLAVGFAYGFVGSDDFGDQTSEVWFAEGQKKVLEALQPNQPFYSVYQNIISKEALNNNIYGHPYSDRLKALDVAANVVTKDNTDVATLQITILKQEDTTSLVNAKIQSQLAALWALLKRFLGF